MSRSGGGPRCWRSRSGATGAPSAPTCGARTPARRPSRYLSSQMRQLWSVVLGFEVGLVDPELGRHDRWVWSATESLGVGVVGGGQGVLPVLVERVGGAEVDRGRGVPRDPGMMVDVVVLVEEAGAELAGVGQG